MEWHPTKNGELSPQIVSKGSDENVWWLCSKCGYEWKAKVKKRVAGSGCPNCAKKEWGQKQYKTVYQFSIDGILIQEYPSARIAAEKLGISRVTIQHVCNGVGKIKTAGGYRWSYNIDGTTNVSSERNISRVALKVLQYSMGGEFIKEFSSANLAAQELGISSSSIRQACKGTAGKKSAGGYIWHYA